ncbi:MULTISPECIES: universal stress protein [unclassified Streptomyces]|uniref:universal stress protein n=1 Tax=unclassified Streptomyces TaxID=2593676 RepID=UPI000F454F47|nr:universal stress protein [Streptomyces sp. I6]RNL70646.1 universal stress protein [Streptomyces sp. I6]
MSDLAFVLVVVGAWIAIGLVTAWWMARRGYHHWGWLLMGAVFGPILALVASERIQPRRGGPLARMEVGAPGPGGLRVLVGVDGSAASQAALDLAVELLGPYAKALVAVEVVGYDAADDAGDPSIAAARSRLAAVAERSGGRVTECDIISGPPAQALVNYAGEQGFDLIVVGTHGSGLSRRLLGNVARELVRQHTVPVLVTGEQRHESPEETPG